MPIVTCVGTKRGSSTKSEEKATWLFLSRHDRKIQVHCMGMLLLNPLISTARSQYSELAMSEAMLELLHTLFIYL